MNGLYDTRSRRIRQNTLILSTQWLYSPKLGTHVGGTGTVIGASANVVALSIARKHNVVVSFWGFMKVAFPLMLLSIVISSVYLYIFYL